MWSLEQLWGSDRGDNKTFDRKELEHLKQAEEIVRNNADMLAARNAELCRAQNKEKQANMAK